MGVCIIVIVVCIFIGIIFILIKKKNNKILSTRKQIEEIPSYISLLGVIGTFAGITYALWFFDPNNLDNSIPILLSGLKTAFVTSLLGMFGSIGFTSWINWFFDKEEKGVSDISQAAVLICKAVEEMNKSTREAINLSQLQSLEQAKEQKNFYTKMEDFANNSMNLFSKIGATLETMQNHSKNQDNFSSEILTKIAYLSNSVESIEQSAIKQKQSDVLIIERLEQLTNIDKNIGELVDVMSTISSIEEEVCVEVKTFGEKLHAEVIEIVDGMLKTNSLLESKFNEFSELLKKSNTEALVEVMKRVTEEFQKQMNDLISKLIQENFDQLNQSVLKLNIWQQENKEMISSLTKQYKDMSLTFESTSDVLSKVATDTQSMVGHGGKLENLIGSLNKVIVEDEKLILAANTLEQTANIAKTNIEDFQSSTKSLNDWVRKQRNFVDAVQILIEKLDELNKIRDYNDQFWKGTKEKMEEGIGIIAKGSTTLNSQIANIDQQFYARLSTTLAELDACIQAMIKGK